MIPQSSGMSTNLNEAKPPLPYVVMETDLSRRELVVVEHRWFLGRNLKRRERASGWMFASRATGASTAFTINPSVGVMLSISGKSDE
mmetsp:Transcript_481/g.916  ORF Transcript_481/g.916 Transcript_481/m.916 type:complete len:87 (-) Transcript_481:386-646(-)